MSTTSFIAEIKDQAQALHAAGSCFASITIAQGIWESASGTSYVCQHANNLFGITGKYNGQSLLYHGYRYRVYPDWPTCIQDHADFLKAPRYAGVLSAKTYTDAANALHTAGYAEDPEYAKGIIATIERYKLYEYDTLPSASGGYTPPPDTIQKKKKYGQCGGSEDYD